MASMQGGTIASFEFADHIAEEPRMAGEIAERSSAVTAPLKASVNKGQTATDSHQANDELNDSGKSIAPHEVVDQCGSSETEGTASNGNIVFQAPDETSKCVPEPLKGSPLQNAQKKDRGASLPSGIGFENLVSSKSSNLTPPTASMPVSSYSLRNRTQSKLVYDVKYHPMDDSIRPFQAAKRRSAHGEAPIIVSDDSSDASTPIDTEAGAEESSDAQSDQEEERPKRSKKAKARKQANACRLPAEGTRRSTRKVSDQKTLYNMDIHPQDKYLVISSDDEDRQSPNNKLRKLTRKRPNADDGSESDDKLAKKSKIFRQKQLHRNDLGTSDGLDSSGAPVFSTVETGNNNKHTIATTASSHPSFVNSPPGHGIRRQEGMDVWHYSSRKRYLNHDRDYWPTLRGQPFDIFHEKLEDQLARDATEAPPFNYEHDNKENMSNAGLEQRSNDYGSMSVIPSAQYMQSSDERQLADHCALVSEALYSDEAPQSYGLDGTHGACEVQTNVSTEYMDILASGGHLPPGQTQVESKTETQDSVLGTDLIDEITEFDSQVS